MVKKKKKTHITKSSKCSLKFSNTWKKETLALILEESKKVCQLFIELLWPLRETKIPKLLPKEITAQIKSQTWLTARLIQCVGKQASGIVRGTVQKHKQRLFILEKIKEQKVGKKKIEKLQKIIDNTVMSKPELETFELQLDSRFVEVVESNNSFDLWLKFGSTGKEVIYFPLKKSKHFNMLTSQEYKMKTGVRISNSFASFTFEKPIPLLKEEGKVLGVDIGIKKCWTSSDGICSKKCPHGHNLETINDKLNRKKKGSKAYERAQDHRTNYTNYSVKQLTLDGVKELHREAIKYLRFGSKTSKKLARWTYPEIQAKLDSLCCEQGVLVSKVCSTYTSQRCSACGWTRKSNRKGTLFKCGKCLFTCDADWNGARNISLCLRPIRHKERRRLKNRRGFYWEPHITVYSLGVGQEIIVPDVQKSEVA